MVWLPLSARWLNLDKIQWASVTKSSTGKPIIYVRFGNGDKDSGPDQIAVYGDDMAVLNAALNTRCADENGEVFLP